VQGRLIKIADPGLLTTLAKPDPLIDAPERPA